LVSKGLESQHRWCRVAGYRCHCVATSTDCAIRRAIVHGGQVSGCKVLAAQIIDWQTARMMCRGRRAAAPPTPPSRETSCYSHGSDSPHRRSVIPPPLRGREDWTHLLSKRCQRLLGTVLGGVACRRIPTSSPSKWQFPAGDADPPSNTWFLLLTRVYSSIVISIGLSVFARLTVVLNTHRHANHGTCDCDVCINTPHLSDACDDG